MNSWNCARPLLFILHVLLCNLSYVRQMGSSKVQSAGLSIYRRDIFRHNLKGGIDLVIWDVADLTGHPTLEVFGMKVRLSVYKNGWATEKWPLQMISTLLKGHSKTGCNKFSPRSVHRWDQAFWRRVIKGGLSTKKHLSVCPGFARVLYQIEHSIPLEKFCMQQDNEYFTRTSWWNSAVASNSPFEMVGCILNEEEGIPW